MNRYLALLSAAVTAAVAAAPAPAATPKRLVATVGPGFTITVTMGGRKVRTLRPGAYRITVRDRSGFHNFRLRGPGRVNRATSVAAVQNATWTVRLVRGRYTYVCDPHASSMRGTFNVR